MLKLKRYPVVLIPRLVHENLTYKTEPQPGQVRMSRVSKFSCQRSLERVHPIWRDLQSAGGCIPSESLYYFFSSTTTWSAENNEIVLWITIINKTKERIPHNNKRYYSLPNTNIFTMINYYSIIVAGVIVLLSTRTTTVNGTNEHTPLNNNSSKKILRKLSSMKTTTDKDTSCEKLIDTPFSFAA